MTKVNKEELLKDLEKEFEKIKKKLGFKSSFDDIDRIFFIKELILLRGYVSPDLSRQIRNGIIDIYYSWINYLQSFIIPNPNSVINLMEAKMINGDDKKRISDIIKKFAYLASFGNIITLSKDKKQESDFIDLSVEKWNDYFKQDLTNIMKKINEGWKN